MSLDLVTVTQAAVLNIGYPPLNREMFIAHCDGPVTFRISSGNPVAPILVFISGAVTGITLDVAPDSFIRASTNGPDKRCKFHWRDIAAVPQ